ncbi:DUF397 domain-containing protein [Micromonospora sp. NPDC049101]|uniref:DUF397 domain-containing protein n=1 Tax=Micromonospora sp. NPDC049101 TaxID=3155032 RepID=UPI0033C641D0
MDASRFERPLWARRSSACREDNCVLITCYPGAVQIGDTKATKDILEFSPRSWQAFLTGLSRGVPGRAS